MKKPKALVSKRVSSLCSELKSQLRELDQPPQKEKDPTLSQKRNILFKELKAKLDVVS